MRAPHSDGGWKTPAPLLRLSFTASPIKGAGTLPQRGRGIQPRVSAAPPWVSSQYGEAPCKWCRTETAFGLWHPFRMLCVGAFFDPGGEASLRPPATNGQAFGLKRRHGLAKWNSTMQHSPEHRPARGRSTHRNGANVPRTHGQGPDKGRRRATEHAWMAVEKA